MDEKSLYAHILNLSAPWRVQSLSLDEKSGSVTVIVGIAEHTRLTCLTCGKFCSIHDHRRRKWRHLGACQFTTLIEADVPRVDCPEHGCQTMSVPCAGPRQSLHFAVRGFCSLMAESHTVDAVRKQLKLSWNAVDGIMMRAVKRGLARVKHPLSPCHLCVDEVGFKKGHQYVTVISDRQGRALQLTDDRGVEGLASYLRSLRGNWLDEIKTLFIDMNMT